MTIKQSYFRPKHEEARKTVHVVQNNKYSLFLQSSSHSLISRTFLTKLHHNKSSMIANIITLERLLQAVASPPPIIPPTTIPQDEDIIGTIPSLRKDITTILNEVESTATCPTAQVFKEFMETLKTLLRTKSRHSIALEIMRATKDIIRPQSVRNRNVGHRQIDGIYVVAQFSHQHLTKQDVNDVLGLSNSWAERYWFATLTNGNIITGDMNGVRLSNAFKAKLVHNLPTPNNGALLEHMKAYGRYRRNWNSKEVKFARNFVRDNKQRFYPLQLQLVHQLDLHAMAFMQTFREHLQTVEDVLRQQVVSPY
jgi:hypothetical protein